MATKSSDAKYSDPALRDRLKAKITASDKGGRKGQWSARKAQLLAAEYKKAGGTYKGGKGESQKHLDEWTDEKWRTSDGQKARRGQTTTRYLPDKAWSQLSEDEKKATNTKKRRGTAKGKQFVANTTKAKAAGRKARKH